MFQIYKITSSPVVDFAAEELKKYLRMMMPERGEITISYDPAAKDGFRLGVMADFGLDTSEAADLDLDDILHIDTDERGGIIAGSNPRSVLLAVYRYLRENDCRWLFPGVDGELIPVRDVAPVKFHKMADNRYRGQCNEGAEYQADMMRVIDFQPKIGMNVFMIEFDNPKAYYDFYYNSNHNKANRRPEPVTAEEVKQWKRQCEAELSKRGLQFHDMGHGWTAEPFGISSANGWVSEYDNPVPEEAREMLAMVNGKRELWLGMAIDTQICMSNPKARTIMATYIADYAEKHQNVDYLHVWLADGSYNHCECENCRKKTPSDWYVMLLNEIDECLTAKKLNTRVVFICYADTTWAPQAEKLANPKRFSFMLAAITRGYAAPVPKPEDLPKIKLTPYVRNLQDSYPKTSEEYILHAKEWKRAGDCPSLVYEYHFWIHQYRDPGTMDFAKLIYDDVHGYHANGFNGLIEDGSQRSYFPNGFNFYVYAESLFDLDADFEEMKKDYFSHAYGEIWQDVVNYMTEITKAFDMAYLAGTKSALSGGGYIRAGRYYNPAHAKDLRRVAEIVDKYAPLFEEHRVMKTRAQTMAMRLLEIHMEYCRGLAEMWTLKCLGADEEAARAFEKLEKAIGRYEFEVGTYLDQRMCFSATNRQITNPKYFTPRD